MNRQFRDVMVRITDVQHRPGRDVIDVALSYIFEMKQEDSQIADLEIEVVLLHELHPRDPQVSSREFLQQQRRVERAFRDYLGESAS